MRESEQITGRRAIAHDLESRRATLLRYIQSKVRDLDDAEDILQDVSYQLIRSLDAAVVIEDTTAWLYRTARNRIIDWYRKRRPERMSEAIAEQAAATTSSSTSVESAGTWDDFVDALADLPPKQRDVFVMHEMEGRSFEEIAELTGEKLNTLLSRKRYAVLALRKRLAQHYEDLNT